ncbi:MAG: hypothetical protein AAF415_13040 [Pseudomonadota bacterium]
MGRKPVDMLARSRKPQGRPGIWAEIRKQRTFTIRSIVDATDIKKATVLTYLRGLENAGFLSSEWAGSNTPRVFHLERDVGVEAPRVTRNGKAVRQGAVNEQMWRSMKRLKIFTWRELAVTASLARTPVSPATAQTYCGWLQRAGYLTIRKKGEPGKATVYQFVHDSGPRPPMIQKVAQVFDPNSRTVVYSQDPEAPE